MLLTPLVQPVVDQTDEKIERRRRHPATPDAEMIDRGPLENVTPISAHLDTLIHQG